MEFPVATSQQLGQVLRGFRKSQGLTQAQVARLGGLLQKTVSLVETNPSKASFETIQKVLAALKVELVLRSRTTRLTTKAQW